MADRDPGARGQGAAGASWPVRALQLVLTVAVTWFILDRVGLTLEDVSALDGGRWTPRWAPLAASVGALFAGYVVSALLWGLMVRDLGGPALTPLTAFRVFFVANLGRYIPGKVWQIAGLALLARRHGVSAALATGAAVLGQAFAVAGATVVGLAAFFGGGPELRRWGGIAAAVVVAVVLLFAVPAFLRKLMGLWFRVARRPLPDGLEPGPLFGIRWVTLYTLNWVLYAGAFWLLVTSFDVPGGPLLVGPAFAAAYVLGYLMVFAPAGIGVREGFLVAFLQPAMGAGPGTAVAVISRLWTTAVEVVPAALVATSHLGEGSEGTGVGKGSRSRAGDPAAAAEGHDGAPAEGDRGAEGAPGG